jgi:hypothetical protein
MFEPAVEGGVRERWREDGEDVERKGKREQEGGGRICT